MLVVDEGIVKESRKVLAVRLWYVVTCVKLACWCPFSMIFKLPS